MLHTILIWLLVVAFFGAGVANAAGSSSTQNSFVRWGYPAWWCRVTGALEIADAVLIALPGARLVGLVLGATIVVAAILTVVRQRQFRHLIPLAAFVVVLGLAAASAAWQLAPQHVGACGARREPVRLFLPASTC